jgi:hypothetical protein
MHTHKKGHALVIKRSQYVGNKNILTTTKGSTWITKKVIQQSIQNKNTSVIIDRLKILGFYREERMNSQDNASNTMIISTSTWPM